MPSTDPREEFLADTSALHYSKPNRFSRFWQSLQGDWLTFHRVRRRHVSVLVTSGALRLPNTSSAQVNRTAGTSCWTAR